MKVKYNAPVALTFAIISALVLILSQTIARGLIPGWFMAPGRGGFNAGSVRGWVTLFTHVIGHADWNHLLSNFAFILLLGPILEESYGSASLLVMIAITALVTGILNLLLFSSALLGASGVVFMMILLASFTNFSRGEIPLTFILILMIYLGREIVHSFSTNNISEFAHIVGGFCGSLFGFFRPARKKHAIQ
ncbi:MAG: rhomboid family intramembrane serine protease [Spirochaetaceae bacterium]|jgi:membrane associated rhomboid family serine protease|nr:rhomboid family intramembrane serine protease [Spirochaetaceae bacterium]